MGSRATAGRGHQLLCWLLRAPLQWPQAGAGQALVLGDNSQERSQMEKKRFGGNLGSETLGNLLPVPLGLDPSEVFKQGTFKRFLLLFGF